MADKPAATKKAKASWPWFPVEFEDADVFALQALEAGVANEGQQKRAMTFVREKLCEENRLEFWPGGEDGRRASDFAGGKRFVALQIRRLLRLKPVVTTARGAPPPMPGEKAAS